MGTCLLNNLLVLHLGVGSHSRALLGSGGPQQTRGTPLTPGPLPGLLPELHPVAQPRGAARRGQGDIGLAQEFLSLSLVTRSQSAQENCSHVSKYQTLCCFLPTVDFPSPQPWPAGSLPGRSPCCASAVPLVQVLPFPQKALQVDESPSLLI